ncbi:uncharacterized protein PV06_06640 [Exophiala oligosperma]|uniref:Acyltransferase 3 domain-containing protein n=2 Tax=Chaetothyriales TaxID=34395 RepID=A0A0D2DDF2_9EURO|nr:uncharacterized protein PV06_06640 [Exophiala oligosperma]KAJ9628340.1 hypothetical protein H2204_009315 [Knufia peltigerae]KIW41043.1 hypothetical protein PV06_06640 [Exophiala oligosperma]
MKKNHISSLDGLRGIACLLVFNFHWAFDNGYGNRTEGMASTVNLWWELPWVTWMYAGKSMVYVFFVISGYVLSYKPLTQIHQNRGTVATACYSTLASSAFRRGIRLFLPTMVDTIFTALLIRTPIFGLSIQTYLDTKIKRYYLDIWMGPKRPEDSFWKELRAALTTCWGYVDSSMIPWTERDIDVRKYDDVHWTIPIEFKCSMLLFILLLSTAHIRTRARLVIHCLACLYTFSNNRIALFCFFAGMVLAEVDIIARVSGDTEHSPSTDHLLGAMDLESSAGHEDMELEKELMRRTTAGRSRGRQSSRCFFLRSKPATTTAWLAIFIFGIYLNVASLKPDAQPSAGYSVVVSKIVASLCGNSDPVEATRCLGAILVTWSVANTADTFIGSIFSNRLAQWLGRISFGIYLTHLDVIRILGLSLIPFIYRFCAGVDALPNPYMWHEGGGLSEWQIFKIVILGWLACLPFVLICGHLFWYHVDQRAVSFSRYVEGKLKIPKATRTG